MPENLAWLFSVNLAVMIAFGIIVVVLAICWWKIFKLTIHHFNREDQEHD